MNLLILSDLHLEFAGYAPPPGLLDGVDAVLLAGDTMANTRKLPSWATRQSVFGPNRPILIVLGNHESYGGQFEVRRQELQAAAKEHENVHILDQGEALLDGGRLRVLGCTLWTDFNLPIKTPTGPISNRERAMTTASERMNDYRSIKVADPEGRHPRLLRPQDTEALHAADRAWLLSKLAEPFAGETVVATHHGPSAGSVAPKWESEWLTPSFSSNLTNDFFEVPRLWVHGHTHDSRDYQRGRTRVVCNPRGHLMRDGSFENGSFDKAMVVAV
jgi:predicted phosphodiesterase